MLVEVARKALCACLRHSQSSQCCAAPLNGAIRRRKKMDDIRKKALLTYFGSGDFDLRYEIVELRLKLHKTIHP